MSICIITDKTILNIWEKETMDIKIITVQTFLTFTEIIKIVKFFDLLLKFLFLFKF